MEPERSDSRAYTSGPAAEVVDLRSAHHGLVPSGEALRSALNPTSEVWGISVGLRGGEAEGLMVWLVQSGRPDAAGQDTCHEAEEVVGELGRARPLGLACLEFGRYPGRQQSIWICWLT